MRRSSLLGHAGEVLGQVLTTRRSADLLLQEFYRGRRYLGAKDRRTISGWLYGILRNHRVLDLALRQALASFPPETRPRSMPPIGYCAAYLLRFEQEKPEQILPDVAGIWRTATTDIDPGRFLDALAEATRDLRLPDAPAAKAAIEHSLPDDLVVEWFERYGESGAIELCRATNTPAPTALRVNTFRCSVEECRAILAHEGVESRPTSLSPIGLVLHKRTALNALASYRAGLFEVQDEGSQLLGLLLEAKPGERMIDACAGAGGKSLLLAAEMRDSGEVVALDVDPGRLHALTGRAERAGLTIIASRVVDDAGNGWEGLAGLADGVLVDAPCSGAGTFRRNPWAKLTYTTEHAVALQHTQDRLLERYAALVKPGGRLVYGTCTLRLGENENRVEEFLAGHPEFHLVSASEILRRRGVPVKGNEVLMTLLPHETGTDGFFGAVMVRSR